MTPIVWSPGKGKKFSLRSSRKIFWFSWTLKGSPTLQRNSQPRLNLQRSFVGEAGVCHRRSQRGFARCSEASQPVVLSVSNDLQPRHGQALFAGADLSSLYHDPPYSLPQVREDCRIGFHRYEIWTGNHNEKFTSGEVHRLSTAHWIFIFNSGVCKIVKFPLPPGPSPARGDA